MIETLLGLIVLFSPLPADTSSPEAAADAFGKQWFALTYDDDYKRDGLDEAKALFSEDGWRFVEAARKRSKGFDEEYATLAWSFKVTEVKDNGDGTASAVLLTTVRRNQGKDYKTKKVRVVEDRLPHKITLQSGAGGWKVSGLKLACGICKAKGACNACQGKGLRDCFSCKGSKSCKYCQGAGQNASGRTCYSCRGNGICSGCKGVGGRQCYSCKGAKQCKYCKGHGYKTQAWDKMWGGDPGAPVTANEDRASPTSAAQAFLNARLKRWRARSLRAKKRYAGVIALLAPAVKAKAEAAMSSAKAAERFKAYKSRTVVEEVEVVGSTAYARIRVRYEKTGGRLMRLTLSQRAGLWLIDLVESDCYGCKGTKTCRTCKGTGTSRACRCGTGKCRLCRGVGKIPTRGGGDRDCFSCKGSGTCTYCKGKGKMPCYGCTRNPGKCYSCKGKGWVQSGSRGIF